MEKQEDSVASFLNEVSEPKEIFKEEQAEEPVVEEEEKSLPFHKDPKVQRYVEKQIEKALKDIKPSAEQSFREEVKDIKLPSSFVKLVGNDTPEKLEVLKDLSDYFGTLKGEAKTEAWQELQKQTLEAQNRAREEDQAAVDELSAGFETIEDEYGVDLDTDKATRAKFVDYLSKVSHKNADGEVDQFADIPSAWETFQEIGKRTAPNRAKELASRGLTRSSDTSTAAPQGRSWKDVDKYFNTLKKSN